MRRWPPGPGGWWSSPNSTKLGRAGFTPIVGLDAVTVLVTDRDGHPDQLAQIRDLGIEVVLA